MAVQTILFDKLKWTIGSAINWLRDHGYHYPKVDSAPKYWRFRQIPPNNRARYRSIKLNNGIIIVEMVPNK